MTAIESQFNKYFAAWEISLPPENLAHRRRGSIRKAGWAIWYLFGCDEHGEFLDFYASHRMTDDRHVRLYADGSSEGLPTITEWRTCSNDPEEDKRLEAEYFAKNRETSELLEAKGFGLSGGEPPLVAINRRLRTDQSL